jgi:flagellar hook-associated protein 1 FlgK
LANLLTSLYNTSNALNVFNAALQTTENNVVNSSTPGYAKQIQSLSALPFDPSIGLPGGVAAGPMQSTRNGFAEQSVRTQQSQLGVQQQMSNDLQALQSYFDLSSTSGVAASMNALFNAFSQLSINPNDATSRQAVLDQAQQTSISFQHAAGGLGAVSSNVDDEMRGAINAIDELAGQIANINTLRSQNAANGMDAGVDATLNAALEDLSQYVHFKALRQPDGTVSIYLGGQTPLVFGNESLPIQADFSLPTTRIVDVHGNDITGQITGGSLYGMLQVNNTLLPSYLGELNTLASTLADQVNSTLSNGIDLNGKTPDTDLFAYDAAAGAAGTLTVNALSPEQIAAAFPDAPGGNGNALALSQLNTARALNGETFAQYYGVLAGDIGTDLSNAKDAASTDKQLLTQAQSLRQQLSGVSLDEEASNLMMFQRAYQATAKLLGVINDLTGTLINLIPQS